MLWSDLLGWLLLGLASGTALWAGYRYIRIRQS